LFIEINFLRLSDYKQHLLKLVSMFAKTKLFQFVILQCLGFEKPKNQH
jgi:hypothetical protein